MTSQFSGRLVGVAPSDAGLVELREIYVDGGRFYELRTPKGVETFPTSDAAFAAFQRHERASVAFLSRREVRR